MTTIYDVARRSGVRGLDDVAQTAGYSVALCNRDEVRGTSTRPGR
jgi:hypothetical protein